MKEQIDPDTMIVGIQHPTLINRQNMQRKINKDTLELNDTMGKMDLIGI
jgi:hypothetical protein